MFQLAPQDPGGNRISQGDFNRGAEGAETETPKALRGWGMERGYPPPHPTRVVWGSVVSSPSGVRGRAPDETILVHLKHHRMLQVALPEIS